MYSWSRLLSILLYSSMAVLLVIVGGQSTTNENQDVVGRLLTRMDKLEIELANLKSEVAKLSAKNEKLEAECKSNTANGSVQQFGASYIRWGRKTCEGNASLLYRGYLAGSVFNKPGGGSNFLCLPEDPQWKNYVSGHQVHSGYLAGVEYDYFNAKIFSELNSGGNSFEHSPAPCAVCYVGGRSTVLMIPAKTQCPDGWTTEYSGYLVSELSDSESRHRKSYICQDETPEVAVGGVNKNQGVIYPVEVLCGTLPCSVYINNREVACVVCSK